MVTPRPRSRTEPGLQTARTPIAARTTPGVIRGTSEPRRRYALPDLSTDCRGLLQYLSTELFLTRAEQIVSVSYDISLSLRLRHRTLTTREAPGRFMQPQRSTMPFFCKSILRYEKALCRCRAILSSSILSLTSCNQYSRDGRIELHRSFFRGSGSRSGTARAWAGWRKLMGKRFFVEYTVSSGYGRAGAAGVAPQWTAVGAGMPTLLPGSLCAESLWTVCPALSSARSAPAGRRR